MSIAKAYSAQLIGLKMEIVTIEVDISNGLHAFSIVGLGDRAVDEARDRISAAIKNSGFVSPKQKNQKVVVSLAPADKRKEGPSFDLAMAIAYLAAADNLTLDPQGILFLGELSLEGYVRKTAGILPILCQASAQGYGSAFIPRENQSEASLARGIAIYPVDSLNEVIRHLTGEIQIEALDPDIHSLKINTPKFLDFATIRGNHSAKRGLEVAAAGGHNVLLYGPPGTGKTMLAQAFRSILPPLSYEHSVEVTGIHSAARMLEKELLTHPPFRSPHHTASYPSVVGGGAYPRPGEITLAHRGVLFLDEFPEFDRTVIEALRQPLEERVITISRAKGVVTFPAQCILVASMNPCPCGKGRERGCNCPKRILDEYKRKVSGPISDRIDLWLHVSKINYEELGAKYSSAETSSDILERVEAARQRQVRRFKSHGVNKFYNSEMGPDDLEKMVKMEDSARFLLTRSAQKFDLSGRAFHRAIKVSQTIADLAGEEVIKKDFILEALQYRQKKIE